MTSGWVTGTPERSFAARRGDGEAGADGDERRGERDEGEARHPVNCDGPSAGLSTASAQAR